MENKLDELRAIALKKIYTVAAEFGLDLQDQYDLDHLSGLLAMGYAKAIDAENSWAASEYAQGLYEVGRMNLRLEKEAQQWADDDEKDAFGLRQAGITFSA